MRLEHELGSVFGAFPEPDEQYREGCFFYKKWHLETDCEDERWFVLKREFMTLSEQAMFWIDKFNFPETFKLDAKRLIWDVKYEDYRQYAFTSPIVIALCSLKIVCDLKNVDFFKSYSENMEIVRSNSTRTSRNSPRILHKKLSDYSSMDRVRYKSSQLLIVIGQERIDRLKRMWGAMDEAKLFG